MENQIDRKIVLADRPAFAKWLLTDRNIYDLDRGRLVIDDKFLATSAVSVAPGGMARSQNNIAYGLLDDADIDKALQDYVARGNTLRSVKSVAGDRRQYWSLPHVDILISPNSTGSPTAVPFSLTQVPKPGWMALSWTPAQRRPAPQLQSLKLASSPL